MIRRISLYLIVLILSSCSSVEKYNEQISRLHDSKALLEDIDYGYKKLKKLHPDLYWYVDKDSLDNKIAALKNAIDKPLNVQEFYERLAPVFAEIRQGHLSVRPPAIRQTKKEKKEKGKRSSPFNKLSFASTKDK